ncbi:uncharacterized protein LOC143447209 isoform X1 [Clavelina lepadiformis]|uniref:uncharacterized protein LOC143447209 isoform X1 n=2 Tax=Clavelina lepadiformis TaxID=159417 RepID=UPI004042D3D2
MIEKLLVIIFITQAFVQSKPYKRNLSGAVDLTLSPGSVGKEVVEACILKLDSLSIFSNDFEFMKRIAFVETKFGTNFTSKDITRGIWQMSIPMLSELQAEASSAILVSLVTTISQTLGPSLVDFNNMDMTIPFHSVIALRLYIELIQNASAVPGLRQDQHDWWETNYTTSSSKNYTAEVIELEASENCPEKEMDVWFLLDGSTSIRREHFETSLLFINHLMSGFVISPDIVRAGMSTYSSYGNTVIASKFDEHTDNSAFENAVNNTVYLTGTTYTGFAIYDVLRNGFTVISGARSFDLGIPRALVVITDGYSFDSAEEAAKQAHSAGVTLFAVGVGTGIELEEIKTMASHPYTTYSYIMTDFTDLLNVLPEPLSNKACKLSAAIQHGAPVTVSEEAGGIHYSYISVPAEDYVTVSFEVNAGSGSSAQIYVGLYPNPSASLHLLTFVLLPGDLVALKVTSSGAITRSAVESNLDISSLVSGAASLYVTTVSTGTSKLELAITSTLSVTTTTATVTTTTTSTSSPTADYLEWWIVMIIVVLSIVTIMILATVVLFILGISRSSRYPKCNHGICYSICLCICTENRYGYYH